ncbi:hypothetical protein OUZ56_003999 [Daphnia magna]|uniref:Uncharacterized protein n=1 Tax=Daphnia magna TaxID=35525 RepID=A0ABQ9YNG1_9CRUS|nr:hypothetical protein OUZ56_003999 [Daphnia magna]
MSGQLKRGFTLESSLNLGIDEHENISFFLSAAIHRRTPRSILVFVKPVKPGKALSLVNSHKSNE